MVTGVLALVVALVPVYGGDPVLLKGSECDADAYAAGIRRQINVLGVTKIYGFKNTPDAALVHAAHVTAEYLDNDADGIVDDALVGAALREQGAAMIMARDEDAMEDAWDAMGDDAAVDAFFDAHALQDLYGEETAYPGYAPLFDASLEEVLHLVTHVGYASAYPDTFAESEGSLLYAAIMDVIGDCEMAHTCDTGADFDDDDDDRRRRRLADDDGEAACEGRDLDRDACRAVGCCEWDGGECWSSVGRGACAGGSVGEPCEDYSEGRWIAGSCSGDFHYSDRTCDAACLVTEGLYWAVTARMGAQAHRCDDIADEWEPCTAELVAEHETLENLVASSTLPSELPVGAYAGWGTYSLAAGSADRFFDESFPSVSTAAGGGAVVSATTPLAVACGVAVRPAGASTFTLYVSGGMDPGAPSVAHEIALDGFDGDGDLRMFAFLPFGRGVFLSATYALEEGGSLKKVGSDAAATAGDAAADAALTAAAAVSSLAVAIDRGGAPVAAAFFYADGGGAALDGSSADGPAHGVARAEAIAAAPAATLGGLAPATTYAVGATWVDASLGVRALPAVTIATLGAGAGGDCASTNAALASSGASVAGVSSNWNGQGDDGSYGASRALDGDASTAWATDGDGDGAWIAVAFAEATDVVGVAFHSRTMGSSAQVSEYEVSDGAHVLGLCAVPDADGLHACAIAAPGAEELTFAVTASSGGNVGAHTIEVYGCPSSAGESPAPAPTASPRPEVAAAGRRRPGIAAAALALLALALRR